MKPITLKMKGINSFLEEQSIDFKTLTSRGIFGIFGPTGSGKTSILDGITLSLYGDISRSTKDFINANTDSALVSFEFEMSGNTPARYRVEREFKRNKTGGVTTKYARIMVLNEEGPQILEERPLKVNDQCEAVIGLTKEDFTRTVVLPQGKFSEFLKLKNKDRGEMLERIFNLQQYGDELTSKLSSYGKTVKLKDTALSGQLKAYEGLNQTVIGEQEALLKTQEEAYEAALKEKEKIEKAFSEIEALWKLQKDLQEVIVVYEEKMAQGDHYSQIEHRLKRNEEAEGLVGILTQWETLRVEVVKLTAELETAEKTRVEKRLAYNQAKTLYDHALEAKDKRLPVLEAEITRLAEGVEKFKALEGQSQQLEFQKRKAYELRLRLNANEEHLKASQIEQGQLEETLKVKLSEMEALKISREEKDLIEDLYHQFQGLSLEEQRLKDLLSKKETIRNRIQSLESERVHIEKALNLAKEEQLVTRNQMQRLEEELKGVPEKLLVLSQEKQKAESQFNQWQEVQKQIKTLEDSLREIEPQRVHGQTLLKNLKAQSLEMESAIETLKRLEYAIALRKDLVDGSPCMVCGSLKHPSANEAISYQPVEEGQREGLEQLKKAIEEQEKALTVLETRQGEWQLQLKKWKEQEAELGGDFLEKTPEALKQAYDDLENKWQENQKHYKHHQDLEKQQQERFNQCEKSLASLDSGMKVEKLQAQALEEEEGDLSIQVQTHKSLLLMKQAQQGIADIPMAYENMKSSEDKLEKLEVLIVSIRSRLEETAKVIELGKRDQKSLTEETVSAETQWRVQREVYEKEKVTLVEQVGPLDTLEERLIKSRSEGTFIRQAFERESQNEESLGEALKKAENEFLTIESRLDLQTKQLEKAQSTLEQQVKSSVFQTVEEVKSSVLSHEEKEALKGSLKKYQEEVQRIQGAKEQLEGKLGGQSVAREAYDAEVLKRSEALENLQHLSDQRIALKTRLEQLKSQYELLKDLLEEKAKLDVELAYISDLEKLFQGKRFVGYIATHQLIYISGKASEHLMDISQGNYGLEIDEEGNFMIRDYKNGGVLRDPASLSGGETFMVSLALALALSAQIQLKGTAPLEFFFLDEGFGTLDEDTLDVVMTALERLHHDQLSIGLISHVETIKNRVPVQLNVSPAKSGISGSRVKIELS